MIRRFSRALALLGVHLLQLLLLASGPACADGEPAMHDGPADMSIATNTSTPAPAHRHGAPASNGQTERTPDHAPVTCAMSMTCISASMAGAPLSIPAVPGTINKQDALLDDAMPTSQPAAPETPPPRRVA